MRGELFEELARRAVADAEFLRRMRLEPEATLARYGYRPTSDELRQVRDVQQRTSGMGDDEVVRVLLDGLRKRHRASPVRPSVPAWQGTRPAKPGKPGR